MPKFSAYMKGGDGTVGPPGASIIDGVLAEESMLPIPNQGKYAFLVGTSDPKTLWVWDEQTSTWKNQGTTASKLAGVTASITTLPWSTTAVPSIQTQFSTSNQLDYFNFDFTIPEGQPAGFGNVSITTQKLSYTTAPTASVTSSGDNWSKNFEFSFGIPEGAPGGFSTNQSTSVSTLEWNSPATVEIINITTTPNDSKSFNFKFGIPQGRAAGFSTFSADIESIGWTEDPTVSISESGPNWGKNIEFDFKVPKTRPAGFGEAIATISSTNWDAEPSVSTSMDGEDWAKNLYYDFVIPTGRPAGFGEINVTTSTLPSGTDPWVVINSVTESPDYEKDFNFEFGLPMGVAAGFSTGQYVSVSTLDSGEQATVEITTVTSSPETAKEFNFHFGLPRGDALAIYEGIPFTTEDGVYYHWDTTNTTTLVFNRGTVEKLPIYIYNSDTNESIAATFKLSVSTIEYETDEKFSGTMYLAMPATLQNVEIGTVSSTTYGHEPVVSKSTGSTSTNIILDFVIPEGYPGHEVIDSLTTEINELHRIYNSPSELGLTTTPTLTEVVEAMPYGSIGMFYTDELDISSMSYSTEVNSITIFRKSNYRTYAIGSRTYKNMDLANAQLYYASYDHQVLTWYGFKKIVSYENLDTTPSASSNNPVTSDGVKAALDLKAPLASPAFTGTPTTQSTPAVSDNSTKLATTAFVKAVVAKKALHISMPSTSSLGTLTNSNITTTMRVVNIVWGTPSNVTSNVSWNTNTAGQLVLSGTLAGATTAEIDLIDFG